VTNSERAIVAVVVATAIMAVIYLTRRSREGDLGRRDALWVAGLLGIGAGIAAIFAGPTALVSFAVPGILILGGGYLVASNREGRIGTLGWLALAAGIATAIVAVIRLLAFG
jgi:4-amino-4-deoxy-L-arabinose transferase-like glycosyltransferase